MFTEHKLNIKYEQKASVREEPPGQGDRDMWDMWRDSCRTGTQSGPGHSLDRDTFRTGTQSGPGPGQSGPGQSGPLTLNKPTQLNSHFPRSRRCRPPPPSSSGPCLGSSDRPDCRSARCSSCGRPASTCSSCLSPAGGGGDEVRERR